MENKIGKIYNLIEEIKETAIEVYTSDFDECRGLDIEDWKNGYYNTIFNRNGEVKKYIHINDFKSLYSNIVSGLNYELGNKIAKMKTIYSNDVLDKVINYLEKEKQLIIENDYPLDNICFLDKDCFDLGDFISE